MVADRGIAAGFIRLDGYRGRFAWIDVGVDTQRLDHEAVRSVGAGQLQGNRLAFHQVDVVGRELELARRYLHDLRAFGGRCAERAAN